MPKYIVKAGDNLSKIAQEYYGDPNKYMIIVNWNRDKIKDPNLIQPGLELFLPPETPKPQFPAVAGDQVNRAAPGPRKARVGPEAMLDQMSLETMSQGHKADFANELLQPPVKSNYTGPAIGPRTGPDTPQPTKIDPAMRAVDLMMFLQQQLTNMAAPVMSRKVTKIRGGNPKGLEGPKNQRGLPEFDYAKSSKREQKMNFGTPFGAEARGMYDELPPETQRAIDEDAGQARVDKYNRARYGLDVKRWGRDAQLPSWLTQGVPYRDAKRSNVPNTANTEWGDIASMRNVRRLTGPGREAQAQLDQQTTYLYTVLDHALSRKDVDSAYKIARLINKNLGMPKYQNTPKTIGDTIPEIGNSGFNSDIPMDTGIYTTILDALFNRPKEQ